MKPPTTFYAQPSRKWVTAECPTCGATCPAMSVPSGVTRLRRARVLGHLEAVSRLLHVCPQATTTTERKHP